MSGKDKLNIIGVTTLHERGQIVIPAKIRRELKFDKKDVIHVYLDKKHKLIILKKVN